MKNLLIQQIIKIRGKTYTLVYFPTPLTSLTVTLTNGHIPWLWSVRNMVATCCQIDDVFLNLLMFSLFSCPFLSCSALKSLNHCTIVYTVRWFYILPLTVIVQCICNPITALWPGVNANEDEIGVIGEVLHWLAFDCIAFDELLANVIIHGMKIRRSDADLYYQRWRIFRFIPKYTKESFSRHRH